MNELAKGRALRDEALASVAWNNENWTTRALGLLGAPIARRCVPFEFTGEDLCSYAVGLIGEPGHPNAKGAVVNVLVRRNVIEFAGKLGQLKKPSSHARKTPLYRWTPTLPMQNELWQGAKP